MLLLFLLGMRFLGHFLSSFRSTDPREPKWLQPSVPFVGHILGIATKQIKYFHDIFNEKAMTIATLPMLGGKVYAVWDTGLVQSALCSRSLSFEPIMVQYAQGLLGLGKNEMHAVHSGLLNDLLRVTKPTLAGASLGTINVAALGHIAAVLSGIPAGEGLETSNLYIWLQNTITLATAQALYGPDNPLSRDSSLVDDVWSFEAGLRKLVVNIFPSITARRAFKARERLVAALAPLFDDSNTSTLPDLTRQRVGVLRNHGIGHPREIARCELALLHVATVNTAPILFWLVANVFARPKLVEAVRVECLALAERVRDNGCGVHEVRFNISNVERRCPLLVSCLREATRLSNQALHTRRAMQDVLLTDSGGGEYLVKAGCDVLMSTGVTHLIPEVWGPDAREFKPRRFIGWPDLSSRSERAAYTPFGGGKHLCPGRNLATAEILGFAAGLALGFEVEDATRPGQGIKVPEMGTALLGQAVAKPIGLEHGVGLSARIRKRQGWDNLTWRFIRQDAYVLRPYD